MDGRVQHDGFGRDINYLRIAVTDKCNFRCIYCRPADGVAPRAHDELLSAAVDVVLETGQASVSMLQRRLKLGYARAARLVDQMEERGYVGPFEGSKPRQLLIDKAKWQELKMAKAPAPEPEIDRNGSVRDVFESRDALD